ncbi:MAG TPA: histidine phosphatase family protein [Candidatus Dormibacteraeota bacterium]|nr:histidine phosphatase family protein [Candidatus Dormibacteraeota bacterium]
MTEGLGPLAEALSALERAFLIGVDGVTEVWLVRHGQAQSDSAAGSDPGLSPRGQDQALRLSRRLAPLVVNAVYCSPLLRARQTALAVAADVFPDRRLLEAETRIQKGKLKQLEPAHEVVTRIAAAVDDAVSDHPGGRVVMVTHGLAILNYLESVLGLEPGSFRFFPQCASISLVRIGKSRRMVGPLGDVAHLELGGW